MPDRLMMVAMNTNAIATNCVTRAICASSPKRRVDDSSGPTSLPLKPSCFVVWIASSTTSSTPSTTNIPANVCVSHGACSASPECGVASSTLDVCASACGSTVSLTAGTAALAAAGTADAAASNRDSTMGRLQA